MRKKKNSKLRSALAIFLAGAMVLGMIPGGMGQVYASDSTPTPAVAFDETSVSDPSTVDTWNQVVKDSTENIGRIWTDKTVLTEDIQLEGGSRPSVKKGDSDFLVGLSALSSTSNTVKTVSRPLDIVLVVDTSGSMENSPHMGTRPESERYRYEEIYAGNLSETEDQEYYTKDGGKITSEGQKILFWWEFTHWELNGQTVEPKISAEDSNPNHIQFYERRDLGTNITKLQALQNAVNNFVEQTAKMNDSIDDIKLQHRVSLVKFASDESDNIGNDFINNNYNRSQIVTELKSYTTKNISDLTSTVNSLIAAGATRADFGLNQAQRAFQLGGTREGAQKVVVFFTDGQPASNSDWSNSVAAAAITNAKELKDANALIYSIGVFRDANPNDTNTSAGNFNGYMHAVSSNYPDATATSSTRPNRYSCTLGKRTDNSDYYKAATDADELNNIFNEISSDLETGFGFPTQTEGDDPGKVGYITFTDQLGEYMQVDEFKSLVFADQIFDPVGEPVTENGVTTYKYEGSATGDTELYPNGNVKDIIVQVKKGADLKTGDTVTVQIPAGLIPLRHFTLDTDSDGNKTMDIQEAYPLRIFYGVSIKPEVRERIADGLNPNDADDEALQQYLNAHNENGVPYFYSNYYNGQYIDPNGKTLGNTTASFQPAKKNTFYYFTEDTPIYTDKDCTMAVKNEPSADQTYYYKRPYVQLNGGQVEEIDGKVAFTGSNFQQASANFGINDKGEYFIKSGSARLTRIDALIDDKTENITNTADVVIDPIWDNINNPDYLNVYLGNNGRLALELPGALAISKDARVAANKNLNADEILKDKKFTFEISITMQGDGVTAEAHHDSSDGRDTIVAGFTNGYHADSVEVDFTEAAALFHKRLVGRDWKEDDSFTFNLTAEDGTPMPKDTEGNDVTSVTVSQKGGTEDGTDVPFGFGKVTYDTVGKYSYTVTEENAGQTINGVTYSKNEAKIIVDVSDPGNGQLTANIQSYSTIFINEYGASLNLGAAGGLAITKTVTGHALAKEQFEFKVKAVKTDTATADEAAELFGFKEGETEVTFKNNEAAADGQTVTMLKTDTNFTLKNLGKVYKYEVSEMNDKKPGYTYDDTVYTVELWVTDDGDGTLTLHTKVTDEKGSVISEETSNETDQKQTVLAFNNSYAGSGVLDGSANLAGTKKMDGPWEATDKDLSGFRFTITGGDEATNAAITAGTVVLPQSVTATSDADGNFNFGDITFNEKGTYKFTVSEVVPAEGDKIPGVAYNAETVTIIVNVTDNDDGTLTAALAEGSQELIFTNTYATTQDATFTPSVVKEVKGLNAKEIFTFKLSAADEATKAAIDSGTLTGIGTTADLYSSEKTTTKLIPKDGTEQVDFNALTFKKAGTYKFTVQETNANAPTGWTYDSHTYEIIIKVTDQDSVLKATQEINADGVTNSQIFINKFEASTTYGDEGGLNVTKTLNGRTLAADMFDFTITGEATDSVTAEEAEAKLAETDKSFKNTAPGKDDVAVMSKLSDVKFDETDIGKTYQYSVREAAGTDTKYTYDQVSATVAITVQEKDGELYTVTTVTKGDDSKEYSSAESKATAVAPFVNSYTPDIVTIEPGAFAGKVTKVLKGNRDTGLAAGEFNFQMKITPADDTSSMDNVVLPEGAVGDTITSANAADGSVSFGNIQFKAAGNYHVEITEVVPEYADPNMTYDKHTFSYDIAVTYNAAEGTLSAKVADGSQAGSATFTNIYEAEDTKDVINTEEPATSVNGKIVGVGDQLTYTIDWVNNAVDETGAPAKAEVKITDIVPKGTEYVSADTNGVYEETSKTITWTLGEQEAGAFGTVSFVVKVLDSAGGTAVENTAEITIGDNDPNQTNTVTTNVPGKDSVVEGDGELQVGKVLTYTISYKNPEIEAATVIITDSIPEGLDYVDDSAGEYASYNAETRMLTWKIADVQPGADGTVTFDARVNESAETVVENKATIQIGENGPEYETDTDRKEIPKDGNLSISKTIVLTEGQGTGIDKEKEFTFIVALKDAKGTALTKEYAYAVTGESGEEIKKGNAADGTEISFQHGQKAVITGLPAGAQYTVTEKEVDGYTTTVNGNAGNAASGTITSNTTAEANFTNTYSVAGSLSGSEALKVTKELTGRKWLDTDTFSYTLTAADEATVEAIENGFITLPENAGGLEITKASAGHQAAFGDIQFTIAGTFKFNVTEQPSGIAGITDDQEAERTVVVKVTDKKNGTLEAAVVEGESENLTFINTYGAGTGDEDIAAKIEASKKLTGRDMKANEFRFEIVTRAAENPEGFKETFAAAGTNTEAAEGAEGAVKFAGNDGALTYTTESLDQAVKDGYAVKSENDDGSDVWTVSYTAREITDKLPGGVTAVEGKTPFDFTVVVTDRTDGTLTAQVQLPEGGIVFENAYTAEDTEVNTDPADAKSYFNKVLTGRGWLGTDEFTFTITPQDGAPAAEDAAADGTKTVTVTSDSAKAGEAVLFGFGKIRFTDEDMNGAAAGQDGTRTKEFRYTVKENPLPDGKMTGVTIDGHEATLKITVSDNLEGKLEVTNIASENGTFTNEYKSQLDYAAAGGLQITKALNGRDMEKDQFTFTVTPKATEGSTTAEEAAEKFGLANAANTYKNEAAEAGAVTTINVLDGKNVTFTQADAGKTFTYEAAETAGTNTAYTYDTDVRTVTVKVKDNNNSTLTVTTRVTKVKDGQEVIVDEQEVTTGEVGQKKATISFVNTYNDEPVELGGEGSVKINATKTLANRPLTDGEFTFRIFDKKGNPVVGKGAEATGTNAADGSITFAPVSYDTDRLMADVKAGIASVDKKSQAPAYVYTYDYTVTEDNPSGGVTGIATTFAIQVIVTDRGDGTLAIEVKYPDGKDSLPFENVYGKSANAEIALNGKKVYEKESVNAPDIAGKYTFTITGTDELGNPAPMPVKDGKVVTETTNDAAGNIDFGKLVYTMENVFGSAESQDEQTNANQDVEAGEDPADTNQNAEAGQDPAAADTAEDKTAAEDAADAAENAASEETAGDGTEGTKAPETDETDIEANGGSNAGSSGEDQDKEAAGAASADGGNVVDQAGTMNAQEAGQANRFSEPRTKVYTYRVTESGSMAGVTNDLAAAEGKTFTVTVTDNGDGTISAVSSWQNDFAFEFTNTYRVNPTDYSVNEHISIKKELTGRDLHEGEFTFELIDESGNVVASAVNEADGTVRFGSCITQKQAHTIM